MFDEETSGEYERLQQLIRGRTAYIRSTPEKMYLVYHFDAWKISRDPYVKENYDQVIHLEGEAHSCPENGNDGGKSSIQNETLEKDVNIRCLGTNILLFLFTKQFLAINFRGLLNKDRI